MPQTPNHGINVPNKGDKDWHKPLNENFRKLDERVEVRDTDGNKGNYNAPVGAKFQAKDTGRIYEGDGGNWEAILALYRYSEPSSSGAAGNLVAGHPANTLGNQVSGATISGGGGDGSSASPNEVTGDFGSIGGGHRNKVGEGGTVGGGVNNEVTGSNGTIAGGRQQRVSGLRAFVGGGELNAAGDTYATISGGSANQASGTAATICGGTNQNVSGNYGTISGGRFNEVQTTGGTIGGGERNKVQREFATVAGGKQNVAGGDDSTVGGGSSNKASSLASTVPGGESNEAGGQYSFAAGRKATARGRGSFAWGDSSSTGVTAAADSFVVQAGGGATIYSASDLSAGARLPGGSGSWSSLSARAAKSDVEPVDPRDALEGVRDLEIATWNYDGQDDSVRHMGPMAEDFHDEFGLGGDRERIANVDADGVAFAAIQGLAKELDAKEDRIQELEREKEELRDRLDAVEERVRGFEERSISAVND